jgi:hypothetical protein
MKSRNRNLIWVTLIFVALSSGLNAQQSASSGSNVPALPADIPGSAMRYSVLIMGNLSGQQAIWTTSDGKLHEFFQFNDRGRGPKTTSVVTLDAEGIPVGETISGNDYLKSAVQEEFSVQNQTARWKNNAEQGEKKLTAPAMYVPINSAPAEAALLVQAALKNNGRIALLPEGEATVRSVSERNVEAQGNKQHLTLYSISGLDFSPIYVWLDDRDQFFAMGDSWAMFIREGWEPVAKSLQEVRSEVVQARAAELAKAIRPRDRWNVCPQFLN